MGTGKLKQRLVPALLVNDLPESLAFYRKLGFEVTGCHPDPERPLWAEVERDGVALQFHTEPACGTPHKPVCSGTFYFFPEDVRALAAEFRDQVPFAWGPEVMEYGMRDFGVQDPNGYYLAFTEPV
jgi:catechol 2,3-dioxygenase-like lactoylglutathione lyase family enzyme